ncbi:ABC transporter substrate-binding protein [Tenuibacillus multivorans]|uniref:Iron complex transport system substrate-binding protein n=1 Tax=Tenuibacillus multivorans TaxID=237069 RepID=A0A1H0ANM4_9BACI|nr:iron-siderophore ABC transporter substrate-binding protein [Tenuibacillus multivorans]GEL78216.1 iron siderophore-binding protein [Tenuibacillus multivorans]SDN34975.1 iron complex transport system substrate-binding protein [Tenuibacillus multivorans]
MFKKGYWKIGLLLLALVFLLAACGSDDTDDNADGQIDQSQEQDQENSESYTVEHAMGETPIEGTPERIVVLTNHGTEALLSLGITPVGAVQSWTGDPWYDHISDQMEGVEVVGTESNINLEAIAALDPDLILANKMRQEEYSEQLSEIAPTVFEETLRGDWKINFELIAEAFNKQEEGQQVLDDYQKRVEELRANLEEAGKLDTKVSMVRFMPSDVRIYHKDSFSGIILDEIGLARPESQDVDDFAAKGVTKERIEEMDGDVIFYFTYQPEGEDGESVESEWVNDPLWNNLSAVQEGKAYEVSDTIWNTAGGVLAANLMLDDLEEMLLSE